VGDGCRTGQEQGRSSGLATPVLVHGVCLADAGECLAEVAAALAVVEVSQLPMEGNDVGMTPRSAQASLDRNGYGTDLET
jgi:hypothetical protein